MLYPTFLICLFGFCFTLDSILGVFVAVVWVLAMGALGVEVERG